MKKTIIILLLVISLCGCQSGPFSGQKQYSESSFNVFDTVTTIIGFDKSEEAFEERTDKLISSLEYYHKLFDIYNDYEGVNNLKTVNDNAGISPVIVDRAIIELLNDCKYYHELTNGKMNPALGSVLVLWHDARDLGIRDPASAALPESAALKEAANHIDFDNVIIDEAASSVYITDPHTRLDVGAVAKGWAVQKIAEQADSGLLISVGGNVCVTGPKNGKDPWIIGIENPREPSENIHTLKVYSGSVVTSGDYHRYFTVDGKKYNHIIDPDTLMPGSYWSSVSVVCDDSALADAMSTALFLLPYEEGLALSEKCNVEVLWIDTNGTEYMTPGFKELIRN